MKKHQSGFTVVELLVIISIVGILMSILIPQLSKKSGGVKAATQSADILASSVTAGNNSYIRLKLAGNPDEHAETILGVMATFEKRHPDKEITGWNVAYQQTAAHSTTAKIFGIWVHHKPKTVALEQPAP